MATATLTAVETANVGMGQLAIAGRPGRLTAVLGSCVGVALYHPRLRVGAMAHVVLPESCGRAAPAGKFADTAVPEMIRELQKRGANPAGLVAKIAGGACMFGAGGPLQIGEDNVRAVLSALARAGVRVAAQDTGGKTGRRVTLDTETGSLLVETAGKSPQTL